MATVIWRWALPIREDQEIVFPRETEIVEVGLHTNGRPSLWAKVTPSNPYDDRRRFLMKVTGAEVNGSDVQYVGSFQLGFVFHLFEVMSADADTQ